MWDDALTHAYFGSVEGLSGGDLMSSFGNMWASGEWNRNQLTKDMPISSDINSIIKKFTEDHTAEAFNDIVNLVVQMGIGMNPQSITDTAVAIFDACGDDPALSREASIFVMRVLQVPKSQLDKIYFDEIGLSGEEASKLTPQQLASRYARYKIKQGTPLAPWSWEDEERTAGYEKTAVTRMKERLQKRNDAETIERFNSLDAEYKETGHLLSNGKKMMKTDYVAGAQELAKLFDTPQYARYLRFKALNNNLDSLCKRWLESRSSEEAALFSETIPKYRSLMIKAVEADTEREYMKLGNQINSLMIEFETKHQRLRPDIYNQTDIAKRG